MVQTGSVEAYESAQLYAKVSGYVKSSLADIGMQVVRGQLLAVLEAPELDQEVERSAALLEQARGSAQQAEAKLKLARAEHVTAEAVVKEMESEIVRYTAERKLREKEYVRLQKLVGRGAVEETLLDEKQHQLEAAQAAEQQARLSALVARAKLAAVRAGVELAEANKVTAEAAVRVAQSAADHAKTMSEYTRILAPFDGVVTRRNYDTGDFIRSGDRGAEQALFTVSRVDQMRVVISVPDRLVPYVKPDDRAEVRIDSLHGEVFLGKVARISRQQDRRTRTMRAEIELSNRDGKLIDGMYASVRIITPAPSSGYTIPRESLLSEAARGESSVFVVRDGRIVKTPVRVGISRNNRIEVLSGVNAEDWIVLEADHSMHAGMLAEAVPAMKIENTFAGAEESGSLLP
jgi:HlyD family secretion protein